MYYMYYMYCLPFPGNSNDLYRILCCDMKSASVRLRYLLWREETPHLNHDTTVTAAEQYDIYM